MFFFPFLSNYRLIDFTTRSMSFIRRITRNWKQREITWRVDDRTKGFRKGKVKGSQNKKSFLLPEKWERTNYVRTWLVDYTLTVRRYFYFFAIMVTLFFSFFSFLKGIRKRRGRKKKGETFQRQVNRVEFDEFYGEGWKTRVGVEVASEGESKTVRGLFFLCVYRSTIDYNLTNNFL